MNQTDNQPGIALDDEDQARANFYALLARLFYAPPDARLLHSIATSDDADEAPSETGGVSSTAESGELTESRETTGSLDLAWQDLVTAAARADEGEVADEFETLFGGSGRSEVSLYVGAYTARSSVDTKLVALREFLAAHGIQRQAAVHEPEDHVAMLFEVMRYLICEQPGDIEEQKSFFDRFVWSGGTALCDAINAHEGAQYFVHVAGFAKSFLLVEHDAFEM
jgi:TorA maturation chaperone TorD